MAEHPPPQPAEPTPAADRLPRHGGRKLGAAFGVAFAALVIGLALGGEGERIASGACEAVPFAALATLAYLGAERPWARVLAVMVLTALVLGVGGTAIILTFAAAPKPAATSFGLAGFALVSTATLVAAAGFVPGVRRFLARALPLDPDSFVHAVALVAVVALTLICFVPLLVLSEPPMLSPAMREMMEQNQAQEHGGLRELLYGLVWLVPAAVVAVGYGVRRNLGAALERLGFLRPTWRQVAAALGLAVALVVFDRLLSLGTESLWDALGWPKTDVKAFEQLMAFILTPVGAVVVGVTAGVGEELAVRGVLQPRLGIWLSNLLFTALHAFQYNWDGLLAVFYFGLLMGWVRNRANTTTCAIIHGTFDFLVIMAVVLKIPWLT